MTSKEMRKMKLPEGFIFENQAKLGNKPNWKIVEITGKKYSSFFKGK